jgi:uncharacterized membrane protein
MTRAGKRKTDQQSQEAVQNNGILDGFIKIVKYHYVVIRLVNLIGNVKRNNLRRKAEMVIKAILILTA